MFFPVFSPNEFLLVLVQMMPQTLRQCSFFALEEPEDFGIEPSGRCALEFNCFTQKKKTMLPRSLSVERDVLSVFLSGCTALKVLNKCGSEMRVCVCVCAPSLSWNKCHVHIVNDHFAATVW